MKATAMLSPSSAGLRTVAARRTFATLPRGRPSTAAAASRGCRLQKSFRRGYADEKPAPAANSTSYEKPRSGFRKLKWTWRAIYLSVIGGVVYTSVGVYEARNPEEQPMPDPSKKNLVILGMF